MAFRDVGKRFQYHLNDLLVRNPLWQIFILVLLSAVVVMAGMVLVERHLQAEEGESTFWWSLTRLMDQGTFVNDHRDDAHTRMVAVFVTLSGVMVMSTLIGIFSSKISERLESLKRGRSLIVEGDHIIVCGNGDRLYEVTRELMKAREDEKSCRRKSLVMFSRASRETMEEVLAQRTGKRSVRRVICRTGDVTDIDSLRLAGFHRCSGFVIIGEEDTEVLKTLIAVSSLCGDRKPSAVCEIRNEKMEAMAEMAHSGVNSVMVREVVMRLLIQICRQPGLSAVYKEILSFSGNEFYFQECPQVSGLTFGQAASRFREGVAAGAVINDQLKMNPPADTPLGENPRLLVLATGPGNISFRDDVPEQCTEVMETESCGSLFRMLVLSGHSRRFSLMLKLLDRYSPNGAEITVAGSLSEEEGNKVTRATGCTNCRVSYIRMDRTDPDQVRELDVSSYDSVMVVSGKEPGESDEKADSECIVALLILKNLRREFGASWNGTVVAEIRNPRNRKLASAAEIDDFVISNEVCSMIMAQLVKQENLGTVFDEIFDPSGCEIQLRLRDQYRNGTFFELEAQGRLRGEVVLGWLSGTGSDASVTLNPPRTAVMPEDRDLRIIAIAER